MATYGEAYEKDKKNDGWSDDKIEPELRNNATKLVSTIRKVAICLINLNEGG